MTEPDEQRWEDEGEPPAGAPAPVPLPIFRLHFNEGAHVDL